VRVGRKETNRRRNRKGLVVGVKQNSGGGRN